MNNLTTASTWTGNYVALHCQPVKAGARREVPHNQRIQQTIPDTPTINQETGPANPVSQSQYIVIKIQNRDVVENVFPEPGCYLVKDVIPAT